MLLVGVIEMAFVTATQVMKTQLTKFLFMVTVLAFTIKAGAADRWETLRAINWVENPTNQTHVGRMHTNKPFSQAVQKAVADEVAVKHYEWIKRIFERAGVEPNAFNIALAWNCGVDAVLAGRAPSASYNYAERVNNLVGAFKESSRPVVAEEKRPAARNLELNLNEGSAELRFRVMQDAPRFVLAAG
jgi:hypothetical protein